jgi:2-iminobutanoate/2-iminopropanoate deaminase
MAAPIGPYSPFLQMGNLLAISGQLGLVDGELVADFDGQVAAVLRNLDERLAEAGVTKSDVIKTTVFLTDLGTFPVLNAAYGDYFDEHRPARSTIGVAALPLGAAVEIEAWAVVSG